MNFIIDNQDTDNQFHLILKEIRKRKNGELADNLKKGGLKYNIIWGVTYPELKEIAKGIKKDHLLALKLWNKDWRESKIIATLVEDPLLVTEEQMDYWTKNFENVEIAEQAVSNLWVYCPYAFVKSLEWCRGKKHMVKYTGLQLMGRLALIDKKALDEMFEPFFEVIKPLTKDKSLETALIRNITLIGSRSDQLKNTMISFAKELEISEKFQMRRIGEQLINYFDF